MLVEEIASVLQCQTVSPLYFKREITYLLTDSRELQTTPINTLFFALKTPRQDGSKYVSELAQKGLLTFVVSHDSELDEATLPSGCVILRVDNVLDALQALAAYKRQKYTCPVIGITGSNGKTVVKEWLYQLLKNDYVITRSPKSYNSQIGVPLSVWQMTESTELAIFEAGISEPNEMERLEKIIRPTIGVITYIGEEHGENFASVEQKRAEKLKLFAHADVVIEDKTHQNIRTCAAVMRYLGYDEDTIRTRLTEKTHETVMEVNLTALSDNVRYFRSLLKPQTKLVCMVKAFAYGAGPVQISKRLQTEGLADYLAVAVADEARDLRAEGITLPIIVMDPEQNALRDIIAQNAEPNISGFQALDNFLQVAEAEGLENYPIHIKIDSGMHRLGFEWEDMPELVQRLRQQKALKVCSVFSHLAAADDEQWDDFTREQIQRFNQCADFLKEELHYPLFKHILNSAGIERFTDYQMDMCRLGIGMYGFSANGAKLQNVCTLKTTLLNVKTVHKDESIGYGRHTFVSEDRQIAVIPIGYADGFDRRFSNYGGEVLVRGKRCPVVGNVCMDLAMVDVTDTDAQQGDEAIIFGEKLPIEELADKLGTITYEILTSVSRRVKRIYIE